MRTDDHRQFNFRIKNPLYESLKREAARRHCSMNYLAETAIAEWLDLHTAHGPLSAMLDTAWQMPLAPGELL